MNKIVKYIYKFFLQVLIIFYMCFFFYWQSKNSYIYFYDNPRVFKIGIPFEVISLSSKNIHGKYCGKIIDICNAVFVDYLGCRVIYEEVDIDQPYIFHYKVIINQTKKDGLSDLYLFSDIVFDEFDFILIQKNTSEKERLKEKRTGILKNGILAYFDTKENTYKKIDSLFDSIKSFNEKEIDELLLEFTLYENFLNILKIYNLDKNEFLYTRVKKNIDPVYVVFHYRLYWLIRLFDKMVCLMKENENE